MNHLLRDLAPIPASAWQQIDDEARRTLKAMLAARKLVDFDGPLGWQASAVNLGRTRSIAAPREGAEARLREVQPLVELAVAFEIARDEIDAIARGAKDADLDAVREAARSAALAEDHAVFHGFPAARIGGIVEAGAEGRCAITKDYQAYLGVVAEALQKLRDRGIGGPYAVALGPRCYTGLGKTLLGGFPVLEQLRQLVDGPIVSARRRLRTHGGTGFLDRLPRPRCEVGAPAPRREHDLPRADPRGRGAARLSVVSAARAHW